MKQVRLSKMCLNETYIKVRIGEHLYDVFLNGLRQRCFITTAFQLSFRIRHQEDPRKQRGFGFEWDISVSGLC
jgi:hypothetical protein